MLISCLLILLCIFLFDFTGYVVYKKSDKTQTLFTLPLGFCIFMGIFELFSLIPMLMRMNFKLYLMIFLGLLVIVYVFIIFKNKDYFSNLKRRLQQRYTLVVLAMATITGIVVFFLATGLGDGWLFSAMALSGTSNNAIFSHNGIEVNGAIQSFHYLDGYYLFQTVLAGLAPGNDYTFILSFFKFLEVFVIVSTMGFVVDYFFKKNRSVIFLVVSVCFLCGSPLFTSYPDNDEIYIHTFRSMALGTNMLNMVGSILFVITIISNIPWRQKAYLYPLLVLANFSFSSSALFVSGSLLFVTLYMELFARKNKDNIYATLNGLAVVFVFGVIYVGVISFKLGLVIAILGIIGLAICYLLVKKLELKTMQRLAIFVAVAYLVLSVVGLLFLQNTTYILKGIYDLNHDVIYSISPHYYLNIFGNIVFLVLLLVAIIAIVKRQKMFGWYLLFMVIFFANPLCYRVVGSLVNQIVYHRVFNLILPGVIAIIGLGSLINYVDGRIHLSRLKYVFAILIPLVIYFPHYHTLIKGFDNFDAYKAQSNDVYLLSQWDFPDTKNISTGVTPQPTPDLYADINTLFRMRPDLNWVRCEADQDFYMVLPKARPIDQPVVFDTPNYNVYLIHGGDVCPANN